MSGGFVTLEGIEGVGKTSAVNCVVEWLRARGCAVLATREPGGTPLGERIRALLLDRDSPEMIPLTEMLLMFAARAQHLEEVIRPALGRGEWVVCDRFTDATYAYQGGGRRLGTRPIAATEAIVHPDLVPHTTLLLDAAPALALARARNRGLADRIENERIEFFERVRAAYRERARQAPERFVVIDASRELDEVHERIRAALAERCA